MTKAECIILIKERAAECSLWSLIAIKLIKKKPSCEFLGPKN